MAKETIDIPNGNSKEDLKTREDIISQVYRKWTEANPTKRVYNRSLKDYINVKYLSITETMRHAAKTYASTLALLQLDYTEVCCEIWQAYTDKARF